MGKENPNISGNGKLKFLCTYHLTAARGLRCAVKMESKGLSKHRVDLHSIAVQIVLVTDSPIFPAFAAGYRRFLYIR